MDQRDIRIKIDASEAEQKNRATLGDLFAACPIPPAERLSHLGLFQKRQDVTRMLFMHELYEKILDVHGSIFEFGVRWGQDMALFETFRGIHEPFNHNRKIVGFDTFSGFPSVDAKDGAAAIVKAGSYAVTRGYQEYLEQVLDCHERESPVSHIRKYELVAGDATKTIDEYLTRHPETILALAYFDFDVYEPTKKCLQAILPHLTRGSVIGFDEINVAAFPGETLALREVLGLSRHKIRRSRYSSAQSYLVIE
jgi:hypothetical protein